ncbi:MAG TPA: methyltransferase domain-containing protein [Tissierellia bacterium]|nr:methyltransferase domain-containing protein [Tissierellia bacterium]
MDILEDLLPGKLTIWQKKKGARFTTDAVLLSAFADVKEEERVLDIGTGTGVIALLLAYVKKARVTAVEIQKEYARLAEQSVQLNGLTGRIHVIEGDIRLLNLEGETFDHIVCNPPFYPAERSRRLTMDPGRAAARTEQFLALKELAQAVDRFLHPEGHFTMIYPAERRDELMDAMKKMNMHLKMTIDIQPKEDMPPSRVITSWTKMQIDKTIRSTFVMRQGGEETKQMKDIYRSLGYEREGA